MVQISSLVLGLIYFTLAHSMVWFQLNGQFFSEWFKNNTLITVLFGIPISYLYIFGTKYTVEAFEGMLWPGRLVSFAVGIITFSVFTSLIMGEGINLKTSVILILALMIVLLQIFWK